MSPSFSGTAQEKTEGARMKSDEDLIQILEESAEIGASLLMVSFCLIARLLTRQNTLLALLLTQLADVETAIARLERHTS